MIFSKSRTETAEKRKELRKIVVAHASMQFCKNERYLSPLLMAIELFVIKVSRSRLLVDVLHSVGFSVSYLEVPKFDKCAALSSIKFDDFVSDSELESENRFWQLIADNFDHSKDTTTGADTTHVIGIISCETPKSEFKMFQPIKREDISSAKLFEAAKFNDNIKIYSKPSKSKFKQLVLRKKYNSNIETTTYQKRDLYWIICGLFMKNTPNWHGLEKFAFIFKS